MLTLLLAAGLLAVPSCTGLGSLNTVSSSAVGGVGEVITGTVVASRDVTIDTDSSTKNMGTLIGAAVGAGAGQMLGGGTGRVVSAAGFGVLGALAGRYLTDAAGNTQGQSITVKIDGTNQLYSVVQPVSEQVGYIPVGTHGMYYHGTNNCRFEPDGTY